ncbi:alpha/beta fold hydrolase [Massilia sp. TN1-12]|uniref:alpha/beta fold hydrolase n=1 Tax=Massilia paldalensis TaxID=3377675 RepID=UPI00384CC772
MNPLTIRTACAALAVSLPVFVHAAVQADSAAFAKPGQLVDIGGRKINLHCSGSGPVTVVFDAASGEAGWNWHRVQPEVARQARACTFDRAGIGFSDAAKRPNTSENAVADLHEALRVAGIKPPYVLVGNSLGGANVQVFAYRYPAEVKGLVLVEPQTEHETERLDKASGGRIKAMYAMVERQDQYCLAAARKGFKAGSEEFGNCVGKPQDYYGPVLGAQVQAMYMKPGYWDVRAREFVAIDTSDAQLRALRKPFGDLPLVVLTRGVSPYAVPGQPQSAVNKAVEDENEKIHKELAALSTKGMQRVVPGAGHIIQDEQPAAVVQAVLQVLREVLRQVPAAAR